MPDAAPEGAIASAPAGTPAQPTPSRRAIAGRALVLVGVFVFVFGVVLPRLIDYDAVRAALAALTPGQLGLLGATSAVAYVANAGPTRVLVPGLSWPHAVGSDLAARAVVSTVPGPTDVATRLVLYRQWSIPTAIASAGIVLAALFETFSSFALPLIATAGLLVTGQPAESRALQLALIGLIVLVAGAVLLVSIVRSEDLARRLGGWLDRMAQRIWKLFRKTPPTGIVEGILDLRERSKAILTQHGLRGFAAAVVAKLAWFVVLEVALWCVGVGPDVLPPSAVLAAMAVVGMVSLIPITPGGVGVTEVAYIGILSSVAGSGLTEQLTAAVMLFRIAQWFVPIPVGWVLLLVMRRGHWASCSGVPTRLRRRPRAEGARVGRGRRRRPGRSVESELRVPPKSVTRNAEVTTRAAMSRGSRRRAGSQRSRSRPRARRSCPTGRAMRGHRARRACGGPAANRPDRGTTSHPGGSDASSLFHRFNRKEKVPMLGLVARDWWVFAIRGIAAIVFGILAFIWPERTLTVLVFLFGAYVLVDGVALLVALARGDAEARRNAWAVGIMGVLGIVVGVATFVWPGLTALTLLYLVAFWAIATGAFQVIAAIALRRELEGEFWMALGGVASIVFGALLVASPGDGLITLVWLVGIWAIVFGVSNLGLAYRLHTVDAAMPAPAA